MKRGLSLQVKLIIVLLLCVIVPVVTIAVLAYRNGSAALESAAFSQLEAIRDTKKEWIQEVFEETFAPTIKTAANTKETAELFRDLFQYHVDTGVQHDGPYDVTTPEYRDVIAKYDSYFSRMMDNYGFYDIFIICKKHGHVMYTVTHEADLGSNLSAGPYRESGLADLWGKVNSSGALSFVDIAPYAPSNGAPASFMGVPITVDGESVGVFAIQIPQEQIEDVMSVRSGMGDTGETYLVGADLLMRSNSFLDPVNHTVTASFANPAQGSVDTVAAKKALAGETHTEIITDYNGNPVLSAYTLLDILGVKWALLAEIDVAEAFASVYQLRNIIIYISAAVLLIVGFIGFLFARSIAKPLNLVSESLNSSSLQIASAAGQLSNTSQDIANGASEQASSIEETTASMEELGAMVRQNVENAKQMNVLAVKSSESSDSGSRQMDNLLKSMEELNSSSDEIKKIIKVIEGIAFQTNILALNAAVEAARAGEAGLGFAVVADEVKNLANKSADAAQETSELIEDSLKKIEQGLEISRGMSAVFQEILSNGQKVTEMSREVETASSQQDVGIGQINEVVVQLDKVVQSNASAAEESASSAEELSAQSETLRNIVQKLVKTISGKADAGDLMIQNRAELNNRLERKWKSANTDLIEMKNGREKGIREVRPEEMIPFAEDEEFATL